jgi:hypothetical protein
MDRRAFIAATAATALPATGIGPALALQSTGAGEVDPLVAMFDRWLDARREWSRLAEIHSDWDTPEMLTMGDIQSAMFHDIIETTAETFHGLHCQIIILWEEFGPSIIGINEDQQVDPDLRLKRQILMGVENLANAATWQPINPKMVPASQF